MPKPIRCVSGLIGWRDRLQRVYDGFEDFEAYAKMYNLHEKLGFKTAHGAWDANPMVMGSVNPSDYQRCYEITWHLEGTKRKQIRKYGPGVQQVFAFLSPKDRADITTFCTSTTKRAF